MMASASSMSTSPAFFRSRMKNPDFLQASKNLVDSCSPPALSFSRETCTSEAYQRSCTNVGWEWDWRRETNGNHFEVLLVEAERRNNPEIEELWSSSVESSGK